MSGNDSTIKYEFLDSSKNFIYDARERGCEKRIVPKKRKTKSL